MKTLIANEKLDSIISLAGKKTLDTKKIISELQALREHALLEKDPKDRCSSFAEIDYLLKVKKMCYMRRF